MGGGERRGKGRGREGEEQRVERREGGEDRSSKELRGRELEERKSVKNQGLLTT